MVSPFLLAISILIAPGGKNIKLLQQVLDNDPNDLSVLILLTITITRI
jgi:hypothetical protein